MLGIELNDRALALAQDGRLLGVEPSAVLRDTDAEAERYGLAAWQALRRAPGLVSVRHLTEIAARRASPETYALLTRELRARCVPFADAAGPAWIALAQRFDARAMGELLSVLRTLKLQVAGFVDAAAATTAWLDIKSAALVLDIGLQQSSLTLVVPGERGQQLRRAASLSFGYLDLLERWLALAAEAMVKRTRFDPLHEARQEQQLFDLLPGMAIEAAAQGEARVSMQVAGREIDLQLSRDQFVTAVAPLQAQLVRSLQELRPTGKGYSLLAPQALLQLPGFAAQLAGSSAAEILGLPDGCAARAASSMPAPPDAAADSVRYLTRVPNLDPTHVASLELAGISRLAIAGLAAPRPATHVLYQGRARAIDAEGLVLGRDPDPVARAPGAQSIRIAEGFAGLSRRHCTLIRQAGASWIIDHSTHGSFLDGEPVPGRAALHAGSVLRLGTPGIELPLIAVD